MSNVGSTGSSVWIETDALLAWKAEMATLNQEAVTVINSISTELESLSNSWKGDSANGFEATMEGTLKKIIDCHNQMGNVENSISSIVSTMQNQ